MGRTARASARPQCACGSGNARAGGGPPVAGPPGSARINGSFSDGRRSHRQTRAGRRAPPPEVQAHGFFVRPRRAGPVRRRAAFFLQVHPSRRSPTSTVEVPNGRSKRAPSSASVASGWWATSFSRRPLRAAVRSVLRPHRCVCGLSVPRALNCWRTRRTAAPQKPENAAISRGLLPGSSS